MLPYDDTNPKSIEEYAKKLIGKTFHQVLVESEDMDYVIDNPKRNWNNPNQKGNLGNLIEERYFGYEANSDQQADFPKAGVELKLTCYDTKKDGDISAGERLVLTMISYEEPVEYDFYKSHVWEKCRQILLIYYERIRSYEYNTLYPIRYVKIITPPEKDLPIIIQDYKTIINVIADGRAEQLSESMTLYLGACTKGSTALKSQRPQYYPPHTLAMKRAFCFKKQYMNYILHNVIIKEHEEYEAIIKDASELKEKTFEDIILERLEPYIGKTDEELCNLFNIEYNRNKAQWNTLAYRMLGIKGNHAEEFQKAGVIVKIIRIQKNGKSKEQMSFPPIRFKELVMEHWENSTIRTYFLENKFFFVIWEETDDGKYQFLKAKMWNMPYNDLEGECKKGWLKIRDTIREGVKFTKVVYNENNFKIKNNLPGIKDNSIIHMRPHSQKSAYYLFKEMKIKVGDIYKNGDELPDGQYMTRQSFWLNSSYFIEQVLGKKNDKNNG